MVTRTTVTFFCSFLFLFLLKADPVNVMVGDVTFTRPEKWTWEAPPTNTPALTQFILPKTSDQQSATEVRFYTSDKPVEDLIKLWQSYFPQKKDAASFRVDRKKIGKRKLIYLTMRGTYVHQKHKPQPDSMYFGAIIPFGKESILIRMAGPQSVIEAAIEDFKTMVETGLKEKENE